MSNWLFVAVNIAVFCYYILLRVDARQYSSWFMTHR